MREFPLYFPPQTAFTLHFFPPPRKAFSLYRTGPPGTSPKRQGTPEVPVSFFPSLSFSIRFVVLSFVDGDVLPLFLSFPVSKVPMSLVPFLRHQFIAACLVGVHYGF